MQPSFRQVKDSAILINQRTMLRFYLPPINSIFLMITCIHSFILDQCLYPSHSMNHPTSRTHQAFKVF